MAAPADEYVEPRFADAALLTIDVQRDFVLPGAPAEIPETMKEVPAMRRLVRGFRRRNRPIVHLARLYLPDGSNADLCPRQSLERGARVAIPGSEGAELVDELKPSAGVRLDAGHLLAGKLQPIGAGEWILHKPRWGAFYQTSLERHLCALGVSTVVVCGCNFPNCPRATAYEDSERDFRVVVISDATSGVYEGGLKELGEIGVKAMTTDDALENLEAAALVES